MTDPADLERLIGRPLLKEDAGTIASLNDVPEALLAEARALGSSLVARTLLAHYVEGGSRQYLRNFIEDVVFGDIPVRRWRRGGALVPAWSLIDQLRLPTRLLLDPIGVKLETRVVPSFVSWQSAVAWVGAPARPVPDRNYRSETPADTAHLSEPALEPIGDLDICVRRWIAGRLARVIGGASLGRHADKLPPVDQWTADARAALAGLEREYTAFGPPTDAVPGFRSPDDWWLAP